MSRYEVDSDKVAQAGAAVRGTASTISAEVAAMMRHLTELQSCWRGGAASAFDALMTDWRATQQQVENALGQVTAALGSAATHYADAELQASRLFQR